MADKTPDIDRQRPQQANDAVSWTLPKTDSGSDTRQTEVQSTNTSRLPEQRPDSTHYAGELNHREAPLVEYLRILHKRRRIAITGFVLIFGAVALYTFTATPVYTARTQILIENENPNVVKFEEVIDQNKATSDYYQTQYRILQSRVLARRTLDAEKLWEHPLFAAHGEPDGAVAGTITGFFKRMFGNNQPRTVSPEDKAGESAIQSKVIDRFLEHLSIVPVRNSRLVDVNIRTADPEISSRLANSLARQYIEQNLEFKFLATKDATDFLTARTAEQRQILEQSEQALQKYREKTGAIGLEDRQNIVVQRLADLNALKRSQSTTKYARFRAIVRQSTLSRRFSTIRSFSS
jgi:succinoglycan biosynthesis transport protein ExoP